MAKSPLWKVWRELDRATNKAQAYFARLYDPFVQRRYDAVRTQQVKAIDGAISLRPKVALILIYQPRGIMPSLHVTCDHLAARGYSPMVVSNGPVAPADITALLPHVWRLLVRPNYGYDFGGYRDGIFHLNDHAIVPDALVIINDSIWFPLTPDETLIGRMEASEASFVGALLQDGNPALRAASRRREGYFESFFYMVKKDAFTHAAFRSYWQNYGLSDVKYNVIYGGERAITGAMRHGGIAVAAILTRQALLDALANQSADTLRLTLLYGAYVDDRFAQAGADLLKSYSDTTQWRAAALDHIAVVTGRRHFLGSFPFAGMHVLGAPFIKKGSRSVLGKGYGRIFGQMRRQYLLAVDAGHLIRPHPAVEAEIRRTQTETADLLDA